MKNKYIQGNTENIDIMNLDLHTFTDDERRILIELICDRQTKMLVDDCMKYESDEYKELEKLKIMIKDM